jgi:hypothetical protein
VEHSHRQREQCYPGDRDDGDDDGDHIDLQSLGGVDDPIESSHGPLVFGDGEDLIGSLLDSLMRQNGWRAGG